MNLRDLEYLVAVDDLRHFRKAAEACNVSQPTLSAQIKKLEETLGVQLIERTQRKVMLTPVGQEVVTQARRVLGEVRTLAEIPQQYLDPMSGTLHIGIFPTLAPYLLPRIIRPIKQQYPNLELRLTEAMTLPLLQLLHDGKCDVLILALPIPAEHAHTSLEAISLFHEPFHLAVPELHPLAKKRNLKLEDIDGERLSLLEDGHCLRDQALDVCKSAGSMENADLRATSLETLRYMVQAGETITLMPDLACHREQAESRGIRYLPFRKPGPEREIGLVFRGSSQRKPCFRNLAALIRKSYRKTGE